MNFNFGEILTRAWEIISKYKVLWIFGILAGCNRGGGGGGQGAAARGAGESSFGPEGAESLSQWASDHPEIIILSAITFILLVLLFIFLGTIGRIGLVKGTYKVEQGAAQLVPGELFSESTPYFGRVFGLSFLAALFLLIVTAPFLLFGRLTSGLGYLCLVPLSCILIPLGWLVNLTVQQANTAIVLEDLGIRTGLRRGWEIVRSNLGPVLIMGLILGVIGLIVGTVVAIPILLVVLPAAFAYTANTESSTPLILMSLCMCLYLPIVIVLQGLLGAYIQSAWTLTFLRLTGKPAASDQLVPDTTPPAEPDSNKTLLASEPKDSDKTVIAKKPDA